MTRRSFETRAAKPSTNTPQRASTQFALRVEQLEARRLLAGLQVSVFVDQDGSRDFQPGAESPAPNRIVYVDLNQSGTHEPFEPTAVTDEAGQAFFADLQDGEYSLGLLTNPLTQKQTTSTFVDGQAVRLAGNSNQILADAELQHVWSVDPQGLAQNVFDPQAAFVDFGGQVHISQTAGNVAWVVTTGESPVWYQFNLESGETESLAVVGMQEGEQFLSIRREGNLETGIALIGSEQGNRLVRFKAETGFVSLAESIHESSVQAFDVGVSDAFSHGTDAFVATLTSTEDATWLSVTPSSTGLPIPFRQTDGTAESVTVSGDGRLLFVELEAGGIEVFQLTADGLENTAFLADATGPVSSDSADGRVITGNAQQANLVLVWDSNTWLPVGSSTVPIPSATLSSVTTDTFGDTALVATSDGVYTIDLAVASLPRVLVADNAARFEFGVRATGANTAPQIESFPDQDAVEDTEALLELSDQQSIRDAEGDPLWYTVQTAPAHGQLLRNSEGVFVYTPALDFNGHDSATLWVHDGQTASELVVRWDVQAVNDPPVEVITQLNALSEGAEAGHQVGSLSVADPDRDAEYTFEVDDPRFEVVDGKIYFVDGLLDFESEPTVDLRVTAIDTEMPSHSIREDLVLRIADLNEAPTGILFELNGVPENSPGAEVGTLVVDDPDAVKDYSFEVSDDRFEIVGDRLKLRDDIALDHEEAEAVTIVITANENSDDGFSTSATAEVAVADVNEPPTDISVTGLSIEADRSGAVIGSVAVNDPDGDTYQLTVNDPRFEIVDDVLRLREGEELQEDPSGLNLTISASATNGDSIASPIRVNITPRRAPHQNPDRPEDVNGDGVITAVDALIIINMLNNGEQLPDEPPSDSGGEPPYHPDVSGDDKLTPLDALLIINRLNNQNGNEAEGEAGPVELFAGFPVDQWQREHDSEIDAELEYLLQQLSEQRFRDV